MANNKSSDILRIQNFRSLSSKVWPEKKTPYVFKSCPKMISQEQLQKLPKNVGDLGKNIVAKGFEKLPKVQ